MTLSRSRILREGARTTRSVIDAGTYIGQAALIEGAVIGRSCEIRSHVQVHEGVAIGDEVTIGAESVIAAGVRIYPSKEIERGSQVHEHLIWESRASSRIFDKSGVSGLVNVDLTPETAVRLAAALGSALKRGARVVASRESPAVCRMIKRAMLSGLASTGVDVADLRVLPASVGRHLLTTEGFDAGFHVGMSTTDPEVVQIYFYEPPGIQLTPELQKEIEKHFSRGELRRADGAHIGEIEYPARVRETYAQDLLDTLDVDAVRERGFRVVVDYGYSAASYVLPLVFGPLGVEVVSSHAFSSTRAESDPTQLEESVDQARRLVPAVGADLGAVFDLAGERLFLIDEHGTAVPPEQTLLLYLKLIGASGRSGRLALPVTVTSLVDRLVEGTGLEVVRTAHSLADLTKSAAEEGVVFGGAVGGGYVFPTFMPAYDAVAALSNLLELLAPVKRPVSELIAELPVSSLVHRELPCPWAMKGVVMRVLNEQLADRQLDLLDGIKVFDERGWMQALPDPDEPVLHLYAEGHDDEATAALEAELRGLVEGILQGDEAGAHNVKAKV